MAGRCPNCGRKIDHVLWWEKRWELLTFDGEYEFIEESKPLDYGIICPKCRHKLPLEDADQTRAFLRMDSDSLTPQEAAELLKLTDRLKLTDEERARLTAIALG